MTVNRTNLLTSRGGGTVSLSKPVTWEWLVDEQNEAVSCKNYTTVYQKEDTLEAAFEIFIKR